jgi:hypothetical protein
MNVIRVTAKAGPDGFSHLKLPIDTQDDLYDVAVVIALRPPEGRKRTPEELGWPPGYFETVVGSITDDSFVRPPQCMYCGR